MVVEVDVVQPFASVTVYECGPAVTVQFPVPVYGPVPPEAETVITEVPPLHNTGVEEIEAVNAVGCEMVMLVEAEQPLASVIV